MTVNISQMIEYASDLPELQAVLLRLSVAGILITTSRESNISDFLRSRQEIYRHVEGRYPMYFANTAPVEQFSIAHANTFSMTRTLRRDIMDVSANELILLGKRARGEDLADFAKNVELLQNVLMRHTDVAVTKANLALFADKTKLGPGVLDSAGRVVSALYMEHYANNHLAATCTGLREVGYVDDLTLFPHYDIPVLKGVIYALNWESVRAAEGDRLGASMCSLYAGTEHREFVGSLHAFLHACFVSVQTRSNLKEVGHEAESAVRAKVLNFAADSLRDADRRTIPQDLKAFYASAVEVIAAAAYGQSLRDPIFKAAWEENMPPKKKVRLLVVTATDTEDEAVQEAIKTAGFRRSGMVAAGNGYGELYIRGSTRELVHVRSSAGSVGASGSELVTAEAIAAAGVQMVMAVGICFGLRDDKHALGDVLVSEKVADYEMVRLGQAEVRERGTRFDAGTKLLSATRIIRRQQANDEFAVHHGLLLSGAKLVDNPDFRKELKKRFPDAIGGEMEATGVMAAAHRSRVEGIVIKAVCDWATGKTDDVQEVAAANAAGFAIKVAEAVFDAELTRLGD
jgi:nucleoside phosphorylase